MTDSGYDNETVEYSYFTQHWEDACDAFVWEPLEAAGLVDITLLPAFDDFEKD